MDEKSCKTCEYANYDDMDGYVCANADSEYFTDFVEADHVCEEHVTKGENQ